jgi:hypothetical protein
MKVIRETVARGVTTPPPPKRNLVLRFTKEEGHKKRWKVLLPWRKEDLGTIERRKLFGFSCIFFLPCRSNIAPCRIGLCFMTLLVWTSLLDLLGLATRADARNGKWLSQVPLSRTFSNSKLDRSLALLKMIFSWMIEHDGYTQLSARSKWCGSEMNGHHGGGGPWSNWR